MINSLEEAIKHCDEVAELNEECTRIYKEQGDVIASCSCYECAKEHRQLEEWLKELKKYRTIFEKIGKILADNGYTMDDLDTIFGKVNEEANADDT